MFTYLNTYSTKLYTGMGVQEFNKLVVDLVSDLSSALPNFKELTIISNLAMGMYRLDPANTTVLNTVYSTISEYKPLIESRDEQAVINVLKATLPGQYAETASYVWNELSPENKVTVWEYVDALVVEALGTRSHVPKSEKGIPEDSDMFIIYNNMWKEFLGLLVSVSDENKDVWKSAVKALEEYSDTKNALHKLVVATIAPCLPHITSSSDITSLVLPKDSVYMDQELATDTEKLKDTNFPLDPSVSFSKVFQTIASVKSKKPELLVYWHYIKVMTTVLGECPPELAELLSSMTSGLGSIIC